MHNNTKHLSINHPTNQEKTYTNYVINSNVSINILIGEGVCHTDGPNPACHIREPSSFIDWHQYVYLF